LTYIPFWIRSYIYGEWRWEIGAYRSSTLLHCKLFSK